MSLAASGTNIFAGTHGGSIFSSSNNGESWTEINSGFTNTDASITDYQNTDVYSIAISGTNIFAGTYGCGVFRSTDNGKNWTPIDSGLPHTYVRALTVLGTDLFAGTDNGVYLSTNNGTLWTEVNSGLINDYTNTDVNSFAVIGTNLFAATYHYGVFLSTNNGASWTNVSSGLESDNIKALAVMGTNLFAGTINGIFLSTDSGSHWVEADNDIMSYDIHTIIVNGTNLYAGTGAGIFFSIDTGAHWTKYSSEPTSAQAYSFAVSGANLFAGTDYNGVWRLPLSNNPIKEQRKNPLVQCAFKIIHPNHGGSVIPIIFILPHSAHVSIQIYDLFGRRIDVLKDNNFESGEHRVDWNTRNLANGFYTVKMIAGTETRLSTVPLYR